MIIEPIIYILATIGAMTLAGLFGAAVLALWVHCEAQREKWEQQRLERVSATEVRKGCWELYIPDNGQLVHVRWSVPDSEGHYLMAAHYENNKWGVHACEAMAERWNKSGKLPVLRHARGEIMWPMEVAES